MQQAASVIGLPRNTSVPSEDTLMLLRKFHFKEYSSADSGGGGGGAIGLMYSPQRVCDNGRHPAGPDCDRNGTCWRFQIAGEAD